MMECPVIVPVSGDHGPETELWPEGRRFSWHVQEDVRFLQQRFPGFCPYHILHNLLGLHYSRHGLCTATPFSDVLCQHGSHQRPCLSREETLRTAPAEGAVVLLPFGLSRRAGDGLLADGCADCEQLQETDACGACRRLWTGGRPVPANGYTDGGRCARLAGWRAAVALTGQDVGEAPVSDGGEGLSEEEWSEKEWEEAEEEWEEEEDDEWGNDAEDGAASWDADGSGGWDGQGGPAGDYDAGDQEEGPGDWGPGDWAKDRWGNWSWSVDFTPTSTSAAPAAGTLAPDSAAVAASAATAAVQAVLAAGAAPAAPSPAGSAAATPGVDGRVRILELELELEKLKGRRLS